MEKLLFKHMTPEEYAQEKMCELYKKIDDEFYIFFIKPKYCPMFIYKFIGKKFINLVNFRK